MSTRTPGDAIMADVTYYVALPFNSADDGVAPGEATECQSSHAAIRKAEQLSRVAGNVGAVAFSRTGDPAVVSSPTRWC
jgi:hypothetical protein